MKRIVIFLVLSAFSISLMNACGPSEKEKQRREQARQDSLERVRQQRMLEQQRQDSIAQAQARQDSIQAAKERERERNRIEFDPDGAFAVQVESWRSRDKAQGQVQKWKDRGYENAYVVKFGNEDTGDVWFRVRLGRVATQEMAQKLRDKLEREYQAQSWTSNASSDMAEDMSKDEN